MAQREPAQPEILEINHWLRLRKYDGNYELFLRGYQNPVVYQNSEGIFDESKIPDLNYVEGMCKYLSHAGELYFIEINEGGGYKPIGDVTIKEENPPIALWDDEYRGRGIGTLVMRAVISRLQELGYKKIKGTTVYKWNVASQRMHQRLGFVQVGERDSEIFYELVLDQGGCLPAEE